MKKIVIILILIIILTIIIEFVVNKKEQESIEVYSSDTIVLKRRINSRIWRESKSIRFYRRI